MEKFDRIGAEFILNSCYSHMGPTPEKQGAPLPSYLPEIPPAEELIALPEPAALNLGAQTCGKSWNSAAPSADTRKRAAQPGELSLTSCG
jgi:hypothetical protein